MELKLNPIIPAILTLAVLLSTTHSDPLFMKVRLDHQQNDLKATKPPLSHLLPGEVGYMVFLETEYGPHCNGALVAPRVIVTAAECILEVQSPLWARYDLFDLNGKGGRVPVDDYNRRYIDCHPTPAFEKNVCGNSSLGFARLMQNITGFGIYPVLYPTKLFYYEFATETRIVGWTKGANTVLQSVAAAKKYCWFHSPWDYCLEYDFQKYAFYPGAVFMYNDMLLAVKTGYAGLEVNYFGTSQFDSVMAHPHKASVTKILDDLSLDNVPSPKHPIGPYGYGRKDVGTENDQALEEKSPLTKSDNRSSAS